MNAERRAVLGSGRAFGGVKLLAVGLACGVLLFAPLPAGLSEAGRRALLVFGFAASLWILDAVPAALTALIALIAMPALGVLDFPASLAGFGSPSVWLLFGVLVLSAAIQESRLDKRIALSLLRLARGSSRRVLLMMAVSTLVLSFILPTSIGRAALMTPICLGLAESLGLEPGSNTAKGIFLTFSFVSLVASMGLMTASLASIYSVGAFEEAFGFKWTYWNWLKTMFPAVTVGTLGVWATMLAVFPPEFSTLPGGVEYIDEQIRKQGRPKGPEGRMAVMLLVLLTLWFTEKRTGLSISYSCLIMAVVSVLPGIGVIEWKKALGSVSWTTILLLGSVLGLARALGDTHAFEWVSAGIFRHLHDPGYTLVAVLAVVLVLLMRLGFPNAVTVMAILLPVLFTVAREAHINPIWLGMLCVLTSALGVFFPSQSITHMTTFSSGYYRVRDLQKSGAVIAVFCLLAYFASAYLYWPAIGLSPAP